MPWNDQAGGPDEGGEKNPWGPGQRQPWGAPPRPNGGASPDLEDLMRRMQERFRGAGARRGGQGAGKPGRGAWVLAALVLSGWAASGAYVVNEGEQGVITRFGAYTGVVPPGFGFHLPAPIEQIKVVKVSLQRREEIGLRDGQPHETESLMLTHDESIVDVNFAVLWQVKDVKDFVFNVRGVEDSLVFAVAESAMREAIGQRDLEPIITTERSSVEAATRELMQRTLDSYGAGVLITQVQLQAAKAPKEVTDAFNKVLEAEQQAEQMINQANQHRNTVVPAAHGEAQKQIQEAEAYKEAVVREAAGEAARFNSIYEQYKLNPKVTRQRLYIETMERVYGRANKVLIDGKSNALPFLPLDRLLQKPQGPTPAPLEGEPR